MKEKDFSFLIDAINIVGDINDKISTTDAENSIDYHVILTTNGYSFEINYISEQLFSTEDDHCYDPEELEEILIDRMKSVIDEVTNQPKIK